MDSLLITLIGFVILIYSIILHEIAHGWMADRLGDPTARLAGRLTLNPLPHIDPMMSIALPLILVITGSPVVFGAARPVPVDNFNLNEGRKDFGLVGLAGPITNLLLAALAAVLYHLITYFLSDLTFVLTILRLAAYYNLALAALNLIPIPPLDGSRILAAILPREYASIIDAIEPYGFFILFLLLFFPIGGFSLGQFIFRIASLWMGFLGF